MRAFPLRQPAHLPGEVESTRRGFVPSTFMIQRDWRTLRRTGGSLEKTRSRRRPETSRGLDPTYSGPASARPAAPAGRRARDESARRLRGEDHRRAVRGGTKNPRGCCRRPRGRSRDAPASASNGISSRLSVSSSAAKAMPGRRARRRADVGAAAEGQRPGRAGELAPARRRAPSRAYGSCPARRCVEDARRAGSPRRPLTGRQHARPSAAAATTSMWSPFWKSIQRPSSEKLG